MRDYLREEGVGEADSKIVGELVGAVNKVNYNQVRRLVSTCIHRMKN
jgi:hypothetical protein